MARSENQGLQIALIIFVMLTIILSVTTFLVFRKYEEANTAVKAGEKKVADSLRERADAVTNYDKLAAFFGFPPDTKLADIEVAYKSVVKKATGEEYVEGKHDVNKSLEQARTAATAANTKATDAEVKAQGLEDRIKVVEPTKEAQVVTANASAKTAADKEAKATADYAEQTKAAHEEKAAAINEREKSRKELTKQLDGLNVKLAEIGTRLTKALGDLQAMGEKGHGGVPKVVTPSGEIRWVNQRDRIVWINLGRADFLRRQISFSVYNIDDANVATVKPKASVEITQILGDHLAEARIVTDDLANPIVPGDKVSSSIWKPGTQERFVILSFIDIDGDGKSDLETLKNAIQLNGGVIDAYVTDKGLIEGNVSISTTFLVRGGEPKASDKDALDSNTKLLTQAKGYGVPTIAVERLLDQMGYKDPKRVKRYDRPLDIKDAMPDIPDGGHPAAPSPLNDNFRPRRPPAQKP